MSDNCITHRSRVPLRRSGRMLCPRIQSLRMLLIKAGPAPGGGGHSQAVIHFVVNVYFVI